MCLPYEYKSLCLITVIVLVEVEGCVVDQPGVPLVEAAEPAVAGGGVVDGGHAAGKKRNRSGGEQINQTCSSSHLPVLDALSEAAGHVHAAEGGVVVGVDDEVAVPLKVLANEDGRTAILVSWTEREREKEKEMRKNLQENKMAFCLLVVPLPVQSLLSACGVSVRSLLQQLSLELVVPSPLVRQRHGGRGPLLRVPGDEADVPVEGDGAGGDEGGVAVLVISLAAVGEDAQPGGLVVVEGAAGKREQTEERDEWLVNAHGSLSRSNIPLTCFPHFMRTT